MYFWQLADGTGGLERLTNSEYPQVPHSWSPDGQLLAFIEVTPTTGYDIWMLRIGDPSASSGQVPSAGSGQVRKAQPVPADTVRRRRCHGFPPTGTWLAYVSNESGQSEIYVQPYPGPGGKLANFDGRWQGTSVEPKRAGVVLAAPATR